MGLPAVTKESSDVRQGMPLLALNEGRWRGRYRFVEPNGKLVDSYGFDIRVILDSDDAKRAYRQETKYAWDDGRSQALVFEAAYEQGQLVWDDGRIAGRMWEVDDRTLYLRFGFAAQPELECFEMIQMSSDGLARGRTWLWYRQGVLDRYVLIDEARVA